MQDLQALLTAREAQLALLEKALQQHQQALVDAEHKLALLRDYLEQGGCVSKNEVAGGLDIQEALAVQPSTHLNIATIKQLQNQQGFHAQIQLAINQQQQVSEQKKQTVNDYEAKCLQQRIACKQISHLIELQQSEQLISVKRQEQIQCDEVAGQYYQLKLR